MFEPQVIRAEHKDVIHDVVYDYHGQRMATCSSDQTVKVNDRSGDTQPSGCRLPQRHAEQPKTHSHHARALPLSPPISLRCGTRRTAASGR